MLHTRPFYHTSHSSDRGDYRTRLLLGWAISLGLVVGLFHLPLPQSEPRVGWTAPSSGERIALTQLSTESPEEEQPDGPASAPPPTRHSPPRAEASPTGRTDENGDDSSGDAETESAEREPPTPHTIASLTRKDRRPHILGGKGALNLHINYPAAARQKGIEGRLVLAFTVGTDGEAHRISVTESLHPLCDSAAVDAIRSVRFQPGTHNGEPVPVRMSLPVRFKLQTDSTARRMASRSRPSPLE